MDILRSEKVYCPYCGELIEVLVDTSEPYQRYIEDCQVCCRPISVFVQIDMDGDIAVGLSSENDVE